MSVLKAQTSVPRIAWTSSAPTHATAMPVTHSVMMGVAVMTLTSVHWALTSAPRIARRVLAPTPVVVGPDTDWILMAVFAMVNNLIFHDVRITILCVFQISTSVLSKLTSAPRTVTILLALTPAVAGVGIDWMLMADVVMVGRLNNQSLFGWNTFHDWCCL